MRRLIACATKSSKHNLNQDYCITVENPEIGAFGFILADGIGSHFKSEISSKFCSEELKRIIENLKSIDELNLESHFNDVKLSLCRYAECTSEFDINSINKDESLGTTLICILDCGKTYQMAYVGNGSIWYISGQFNKFGHNFYLPRNAVNLLNPHSIEEDGRIALCRYLSISNAQHNPTIITLSKDQSAPGEIIIASTDGFYSNDKILIGKDNDNKLWIKVDDPILILFKHLSKLLYQDLKEAKNKDLEVSLYELLDELLKSSIINDDASIGAIISENTIEYHQSKFK